MAAITLEKARAHLEIWLNAEQAIADAQSYTIGSRSLTRADLADVRKQIDYWTAKVVSLEKGAKSRIYRAVPRDL